MLKLFSAVLSCIELPPLAVDVVQHLHRLLVPLDVGGTEARSGQGSCYRSGLAPALRHQFVDLVMCTFQSLY